MTALDPFNLLTSQEFPDDPPEPSLRPAEDLIEPDLATTERVRRFVVQQIDSTPVDGYRFASFGEVPAPLAAALARYRRLLFLHGIPLVYGLEFTAALTRQLFGCDIRLGVAGSERTSRRFLVLGERGCGKERIAEVIGRTVCATSARADAFRRYNAAAFHQQTLMSTLFGHVRGAFTGAARDRPGVFEDLDGGGAVFLDEIGDISDELQVALLRILETGEFHRLGAEEKAPRSSSFHLIAATNRPKSDLATVRGLRADLVDRLADHTVHVPPLRRVLRQHRNPQALFEHMLSFTCEELGLSWRVADSLVQTRALGKRLAQVGYDWPGNLRELAAVLREAVWIGHGVIDELEARAAPPDDTPEEVGWGSKGALDRALDAHARRYYEHAAAAAAATLNEIADRLGVSRQRAARDLRRFGLRH